MDCPGNTNSSVMLLSNLLKSNGWEIKTSPPDGHCLLHSLITSTRSQLPDMNPITLKSIKEKIDREVTSNYSEYLNYGFTDASLNDEMHSYIHFGVYDSGFGDLVPVILSRVCHINIVILDTSRSGEVTKHTMNPRTDTTHYYVRCCTAQRGPL